MHRVIGYRVEKYAVYDPGAVLPVARPHQRMPAIPRGSIIDAKRSVVAAGAYHGKEGACVFALLVHTIYRDAVSHFVDADKVWIAVPRFEVEASIILL